MGRWVMRTSVAVAFWALVMAWAAPVDAQTDDERARAHFLAGSSYFDQGRYEDAIREFELGYQLSGRTALLLNVATSLERLGRFTEAADKLDEYLASEPDTDSRATLTARATHLRARGEAAEASRNALESPEDPMPDGTSEDAARPDDGGLTSIGITGVTSLGVGVASLIVSLATGLTAHGRYGDLQDICDEALRCPDSARKDRNAGLALSRASTATMFAGLALATAGTVLLVIDLSDEGEVEREVRITTGPTLAGLSLEGTF